MPEVSVIIPTYNRAHLLPRTIGSVLNQEYKDFEIIVVDDGSTDNTPEVIKGFRDERLRYIRLPENSGWSSKPRNVGLSGARGRYLAFLDSDDEWLPLFLSKLTTKIKEVPDKVGVVYCGLIVVYRNNGRGHIVHYKRRGKVFPDSLEVVVCGTTVSLIKRECFDSVGVFDEHDNRFDHRDMIIRLSKSWEFDYILDALAKYNCHAGQKSHRNLETRRAIFERYAEDYAQHPAQAGVAKLFLGIEYARVGERREALVYILPNLRYLWRAITDSWHTHQSPMRRKVVLPAYLFLEMLRGRKLLR